MSRTVLITGSGGGIGKALASAFAQAGWQVAGLDVKGDGQDCDLFVKTDVSDPRALDAARESFSGRFSSLDCIINNAAVQVVKPLLQTTPDEWASVFRTNVDSIFHVTRFFAGLMEGGAIINLSSVHARATSSGVAAYAATKGAISALTRAMALELAPEGIRVNAILPGAVDSPMLQESLARSGEPETARARLVKATPLRRIGSPGDVARLALFLADSEASGNITGQEFVCDGGVLARLASE